jgi:tRNA threonylcarbamoyladenosine biosynthesis protein TsaB
MRILALDTTARQSSVALVRDGQIEFQTESEGTQPPANRLPTELINALARAGLSLDVVDAFAVAAGPGSFTGLRIGIATMQGLALATGRPLVGVSTLDALSAVAIGISKSEPGRDVATWIDAWRGEVYAACYTDGEMVVPAEVGVPSAVLERLEGRRLLFVGNGAAAHRSDIESTTGIDARFTSPLVPPLAASVGRLAEVRLRGGERFLPHVVQPVYVRRPDAELARDARARN